MKRILLGVLVFSIHAAHAEGFFSDGLLHAKPALIADASSAKNAASVRVLPYVDARIEHDARLLGTFDTRIGGLSGTQLRLDTDVAMIATNVMKSQFAKAGFAVLPDNAAAKFELSGTVKTLTLNSKARDEINIVVQTNLTDLATGKVIWSADVAQKNNRFAGVGGNNRDDIVDFLYREVQLVSDKTVNAVNSLLMASYPGLFNLTPGTKTIDGVTVLTAPLSGAVAAAVVSPVATPAATSVAVTAIGVVRVSSQPTRAKIYVDDVYYGMSPQRLELDAGVHSLMAKVVGYKTETEKVLVRKGEATELEFTLSK